MIPVVERFNSSNFSTRLFGLNITAELAEEIQEPVQDEAFKVDFGSGWGKMGSHAISFQTEQFEQANLDGDYFGSTAGITLASEDVEMKPEQLSGLGFDAPIEFSTKGYVIDQGIRAQQIVETTGLATGQLILFVSPVPGTGGIGVAERAKESLRRFGLLRPSVA